VDWDNYKHLHGQLQLWFDNDDDALCRGALARDREGNPVHYNDDRACCWCLLGAICKIYFGTVHWPIVVSYINQIAKGYWEVWLIQEGDRMTPRQTFAFLKEHRL